MIFAKATSPTLGRIISLAMILPHKPAARAKLTISWTGECPYKATLYIYAPAMSVERLRRLSAQSDCNWGNPATCSRAERPRGRVLFVQQQRSGVGYEHRWVDYDMLLPG
jgi:hypothetical protein